MKKYFKRYQYYSKEGVKWTEWFECTPSALTEKWQLKGKLRNEFKVINN